MTAQHVVSSRQFFHGSDQELKPGDRIKPPAATGTPNWLERTGAHMQGVELGPHYRADRVYHSSQPHDAAVFGKHVYEVKPTADWHVDPEDAWPQTGIRWTRSKSAKVVRKL